MNTSYLHQIPDKLASLLSPKTLFSSKESNRIHIDTCDTPDVTYRNLYKGVTNIGIHKGILATGFIVTFLRNSEIFCFCSFA